jgi:hypothetical protein
VGLTYEGGGDSLALTAARRQANTITIAVSHFSGVLAGFGTTQDVEALFLAGTPPLTSSNQVAADQLLYLSTQTPRDGAAELQVMEIWFDILVLPELTRASTDAQLLAAVDEYENWRRFFPDLLDVYLTIPGGENAPSLVQRRAQWEQAFATAAKAAIAANKQLCAAPGLASGRVAALNNALFWHRLARFMYFVATTQNGLDLSALQAGLCAKSISQNVVLPDPLLDGQGQNLDVTFALEFTDGVVVPADFVVTTTGQGADLQFPGATAATPPGFYTGIITPTGGTVTLDLAACYAGGGLLALSADEICHSTRLVRDVEPALTIDTSTLPVGTVGASYSASLQASGGSGTYQWSVTAGQLPPGLSLGSSGALTGTPTTAGTFGFTASVLSGTQNVQRAVSITIGGSGLTIDTSVLPGGAIGTSYSQTLQASGGSGSYQWSVAGGQLPPGVSLSAGGTISGTPTTAGIFNFTLAVASGTLSAQRALTITVSGAAPPTLDVSGLWESNFPYTDPTNPNGVFPKITLQLTGSPVTSGTWSLSDGIHSGNMAFTVGGIDPVCPGCGYLISNFTMTGIAQGVWTIAGGARHVCEPAKGECIVIDLQGSDSHGHNWLARRISFRRPPSP